MQKATPVKEVCNVAPSGLMTPRDAAVYIGEWIDKNVSINKAE